jgi:hypothetical protein
MDVDNLVYGGVVNITVSIAATQDHIIMHSVGLNITSVSITLDNTTVLFPVFWLYPTNSYLVLNLTEMVPPQNAAVISIAFNGVFTIGVLTGLYPGKQHQHNINKHDEQSLSLTLPYQTYLLSFLFSSLVLFLLDLFSQLHST